ncbi:MAG: DUF1002 domain-containing protein, partial [Lachnospiraceae bacterium]|nr:DUF1002 domain-containing protein [Lachnospiraceae bacterium]
MLKKKLTAVLMSAFCLATAIPSVPAMADGQKVVTLGADLSEEQRDMILKYFGVYGETIETLTITNADEREHLGSYIPLEQIGTRTYSCALVNPTTSGGIQVKTANLTYVTSNMIASTLSTSGVVNCDVLAAAPFAVSGTGALTGILMAYETASGETLDEEKKETATQELVTTTTISNSIGQIAATQIVNETKIQVIEGNVVSTGDIEVIVNEVAEEEEITLSEEEYALLVDLLEQIAQQDYDYAEMSATLERVEENLNELAEEVSAENSTDTDTSEAADSTETVAEETEAETELAEDSILLNTDDSALGADVVFDATNEAALTETESSETEASEEVVIQIGEETEASIETEAAADDSGLDITISDSYSSETTENSDSSSDITTDSGETGGTVETEIISIGEDASAAESGSVAETDVTAAEETTAVTEPAAEPETAAIAEVIEEETAAIAEVIEEETAAAVDVVEEETVAAVEAITASDLVLYPNTDSGSELASVEAGLNCLTVSASRTDLIAGSGSVTVYNADNGSVIETVQMSDTAKVVSELISDSEKLSDLGWTEGIEFRIYLDSPLAQSTTYYIVLSDDALTTSDASASFQASTDSIDWYFETLDYGIGLRETVNGILSGSTATGSIYLDAESGYAVIDAVTVDDADAWETTSVDLI